MLTHRFARGRLAWWVLLLIAGVAGAGAWRWHVKSQPGAEGAASNGQAASAAYGKGGRDGGGRGGNRPTTVRTGQVTLGDMDVAFNAIGTVVPMQTATVRVRVDGLLQRVLFKEGQMVKAGDLLAEIDPRPFQVQLTQAQGALQRDQAQLQNARNDLARYRSLLSQDAGSQQQVDNQLALVRQYEGLVLADQGSVDSARLQLSFTRVTSPLSGRIGLRQVDAGNMVHSTDANGLATITQVQPASVVFAVPQDRLPAVLTQNKPGHTLPVTATDRDGSSPLAQGQLLTLDNQIDVSTGTVKAKAVFDNADQRLFPNQFVNVRLRVQRLQGVLIAPDAAIQRGTQGSFVYVVMPDQSVKVQPVSVGVSDAGRVQITKGLQANDVVVIDGLDKMRDGAKVDVSKREAQARATGASQP